MAVREADQAGVTEGRRDARMLRWLRRQVNQDLRYWRHNYADCHLTQDRREQLVADCKAKLVLLSWADSWARVRGPGYGYPGRPEVQAAMLANLQLVKIGRAHV